jgi:hypothetical protein
MQWLHKFLSTRGIVACGFISASLILTSASMAQTMAPGFPLTFTHSPTSNETVLGLESDQSGVAVAYGTTDTHGFIARATSGGGAVSYRYTETNKISKVVDIVFGTGGEIFALVALAPTIPFPPTSRSLRVLKFSSSLTLLQTYPGFAYGNRNTDPVAMVRESATGKIFVTGTYDSVSNGKDIIVAGFLTTGSTTNPIRDYVGNGGPASKDDFPLGIAIDSAGKLLIGGTVAGSAADSRHFLALKYDPATNGNLWNRRYFKSLADPYCKSAASRRTQFHFVDDTVFLSGATLLSDPGIPLTYQDYEQHTVAFNTNDPGHIYESTNPVIRGNLWTVNNAKDSSFTVTRTASGTLAYGTFVSYPYNNPSMRIDPVFTNGSAPVYGLPTLPVAPGTPQILVELGATAALSSSAGTGSGPVVHLGGIGVDTTSGRFLRTLRVPPNGGAPIWSGGFLLGVNDEFGGISSEPDGSVFSSASVQNLSGNKDFVIVRYL